MRVDVGATSVIQYFKLVDPSTGDEEVGLTITDLDMNYIRDGANPIENDATEHANLNDAYAANKMKEVGTAAPGLYRADFPDAAFVAGVNKVHLIIEGAAIDTAIIECEIRSSPPTVAEFEARTIVSADYVVVGDTLAGVTNVGTVTGNVDGSVASVTGAVGSVTGSVGSVVGAVGSVTGAVGSVTGAVGSVTAGVTLTGATIDSVWDEVMEVGITARQSLRVSNSFLAGETNGGGTVTIRFRDLADTLNRITMTVDADGDRSGVALNLA